MARKPRVHFPGALYHVISRGNQRQDIFLDDQDLGCMVTDVSKHFQRSPMRMSQAIIQFENELNKDEPLRKTIEKLREVLIKKGKKKYFISIA